MNAGSVEMGRHRPLKRLAGGGQSLVHLAGPVDGSLAPFEALEGWRWAETRQVFDGSPAFGHTSAFMVIMNKKRWDALPPDMQKIIQQVSDGWGEKDANNWFTIEKPGKELKMSVKVMKKANGPMTGQQRR
jgi:TRAP-type C4-dicarboxylate transport system substrate-binding protein